MTTAQAEIHPSTIHADRRPLWADTTELKRLLSWLQFVYPNSWLPILILSFAGLVVLTWRCMGNGLWVGLSGKRSYYFGSASLQLIGPALVLLVAGIWSNDIDRAFKHHSDLTQILAIRVIGWILAFLVIVKIWLSAFSWNKITPHRTGQYLFIWSGATCCFVILAVLSRPPFDTYRQGNLYLLAALLLFPFGRLGLAPLSLINNRHR